MTGDDGGVTAGRTSFAADRIRRTAEVDRWLAGLLGPEPDVALVAVGSHGRRELTPGSDLDLVLVHRGRRDIAQLADRLWYPVWDSGARLDHAVRTVAETRAVARRDMKAALGLLHARHLAGDPSLTEELRRGVLGDWRADARKRLPELRAMTAERAERFGEVAFLLEADLKEARGGLRDVHAMQAVAAAWVAPAPGPRVRAAYELLLDIRHALHEVTGRATDRLVFQEHDEVAHALGMADAWALLRALAEAGRTVSYAADQSWRQVERYLAPRRRRWRGRQRRPLAEGVVEYEGEVVLARAADPDADPVLVLRAAAAAAQAGLTLAPATVERLARGASLPQPWPIEARDALLAMLGAGPGAIPVFEALDQAGIIVALLPDWERVRNRPQRSPVHRFTVDRHLVETAARAAAFTRDVSRPDLLLLAALFHDIGKGWPGDHSTGGSPVAYRLARRIGLTAPDADTVATLVRHHLLLPRTATRRDLDDPETVAHVVDVVGDAEVLHLLFRLTIADGGATGPAAWNSWKEGLVAELVRRVEAALRGQPPPTRPELTPDQLELAEKGGPDALVRGDTVTVVAPDRSDLLWRAAGVLTRHRLAVRAATCGTHGSAGLVVFTVTPEYGTPPEETLLVDDLRRALTGRLDVERLAPRRAQRRRGPAPVPPRVAILDDASRTATVVEVRAHDEPGLLWRIGRALGECGLHVRAARVETLGAEAVDVFYVVDGSDSPVTDATQRALIRAHVLAALQPP